MIESNRTPPLGGSWPHDPTAIRAEWSKIVKGTREAETRAALAGRVIDSFDSAEDRADIRAAIRVVHVDEQRAVMARSRLKSAVPEVTTRLQNLRTLADEIFELLDECERQPERVEWRALNASLRFAETELDAAVGTLARRLGLAALPQE